jgi:hypothetical protein
MILRKMSSIFLLISMMRCVASICPGSEAILYSGDNISKSGSATRLLLRSADYQRETTRRPAVESPGIERVETPSPVR